MSVHAPLHISELRLPRWLCSVLFSSHLSTELLSPDVTLALFISGVKLTTYPDHERGGHNTQKQAFHLPKCTLSNAINDDSVSLGPGCPVISGNNKDFSFSPSDHKCCVISAVSALNQVASCLFFKMKLYFFSLIAFSGALLTSRRGWKKWKRLNLWLSVSEAKKHHFQTNATIRQQLSRILLRNIHCMAITKEWSFKYKVWEPSAFSFQCVKQRIILLSQETK